MTEPKYYQEAQRLLGVHEVSGLEANQEIVSLFTDAGHPEVISDEVPWCAAFVGGCLARGNKKNTGTLVARDYLTYGEKLSKPEKYCIGVMKRGNSSWEGHVGFVSKWDKEHVWLLGGNQSNSVSEAKFPRSKFIGFVKPIDNEADMSLPEMAMDSRRVKTQVAAEGGTVVLGLTSTALWTYVDRARDLMQDHAGWFILGVLTIAWGSYRLFNWMSHREYRQGRYVPSRQL